jgi:NitT/TauT family transport system substrate-binding protein
MSGMVQRMVRTPLTLAVALGLLLAACGGDGGGQGSTGGTAAGGGPEVKELTVGVLPVIDVAPLYVAQAAGYFQAEGLTVKFQQMQGGAAIIPAMVSGEVQVAFSNYVSLYLAKSNNIDLKLIGEGVRAKPGFSGIMVLPDSPIKDAAGLAGKKVAVNTLNNIGEIVVRSTVEAVGADHNAVQFVELPLPEHGAALQRGDIDAAWTVEPWPTNLKSTLKAVSVADPYSGPTDKLPVAGYAVTSEFASKNPNTVAAFLRALAKGAADSAQMAKLQQAVPTFTQLSAEIVGLTTPPEYRDPKVDAKELQRVADLMVKYGKLKAPLDVASIVNSGS